MPPPDAPPPPAFKSALTGQCRCGAPRFAWHPYCSSCFSRLPSRLIKAVRGVSRLAEGDAERAAVMRDADGFLDAWDREQAAKHGRLFG